MPFAHLADCHIGAWRDPALKELPIQAFERAVTIILERRLGFVLVAGDLFNTSVPPLDMVKRTVTQLQRLKEAAIPVYAVAGSHDYSPTGKTMLDVLEEAGLLVNVMKGEVIDATDGKGRLRLRFTQDAKTGFKLTGILGRAGQLDKRYYEDLDRESLEQEPGEKLFLFHAPITELKTKGLEQMDSSPISLLPKGFRYYAGGHLHIVNDVSLPGYAKVVYPGPLFPASFSELEELGNGSFVIVDDAWNVERVPVSLRERAVFIVDAEGKSAEEVNQELVVLEGRDVEGRIVLLRVVGELREGRASDLRLKELTAALQERGALVLRNTAKLAAKEFERFQVTHGSAEEVERRVLEEHAGQVPIGLEKEAEVTLTQELLAILGEEQPEGEKKYAYEERVVKAAKERLER